MLTQLQVRIISAAATLIGIIVFFFILDHFAHKKALNEIEKMKGLEAQQKGRKKKINRKGPG